MRLCAHAAIIAAVLLAAGCASNSSNTIQPQLAPPQCDIKEATPWIEKWLGAWNLTSQQILKLPNAAAPEIVFYDSSCIYTTSAVTAGSAPVLDGPRLRGMKLPWRAFPHSGTFILPDASESPIQLMSFANSVPERGPFFVMAAPAYWEETGRASGKEHGLTGVFLHEFTHTRQIAGMSDAIGPIDANWPFPEELTDDAVQTHFKDDPAYVEAWTAECDLLYRAAVAPTDAQARTLAKEALAMMRSRHARWFTGDNAIFAKVDNIFLAMEGVAQWAAYAWLSHPQGGGVDRQTAIDTMLGRRRWWTQDEGLALLLVVDRLLPGWPALEFSEPALGALDLLERAVQSE